MKQQSAWLLNHISTHPIKQWRTKLGPKSRHKAHSRAIESIWLHPSPLHHTPHGPESRITPQMPNVESISLSRSYRCSSGPACMPTDKTCWYCLIHDGSLPLFWSEGGEFSVWEESCFSTSCCNARWRNREWKPHAFAKMPPWHLVKRFRTSAA